MPPETAVPPAAGQAQADAGALAKASALAIMRACTESGFPNLAAKALESGWSLDEVKARLGNAAEIKRLCATARLPDRATGYIEAGLKPDEVRAQLFDALAAADQATQVNTTQSPGNFNMPGGIKGDPARQREALTQLNPNKVYAARRELMKGG